MANRVLLVLCVLLIFSLMTTLFYLESINTENSNLKAAIEIMEAKNSGKLELEIRKDALLTENMELKSRILDLENQLNLKDNKGPVKSYTGAAVTLMHDQPKWFQRRYLVYFNVKYLNDVIQVYRDDS
jgi:hypothetical protein